MITNLERGEVQNLFAFEAIHRSLFTTQQIMTNDSLRMAGMQAQPHEDQTGGFKQWCVLPTFLSHYNVCFAKQGIVSLYELAFHKVTFLKCSLMGHILWRQFVGSF